jgi:hypothetical protein
MKMKNERRSHKNKSKKPWMPRSEVPIPPGKVIPTQKQYNRKRERQLLLRTRMLSQADE